MRRFFSYFLKNPGLCCSALRTSMYTEPSWNSRQAVNTGWFVGAEGDAENRPHSWNSRIHVKNLWLELGRGSSKNTAVTQARKRPLHVSTEDAIYRTGACPERRALTSASVKWGVQTQNLKGSSDFTHSGFCGLFPSSLWGSFPQSMNMPLPTTRGVLRT